MKTDIVIVSCERHFPWLRWALKSIDRFASGFRQVLVLIPDTDLSAIYPLLTEFSTSTGVPIRIKVYPDWPGKGFLRHEHVILCSDHFTDADFVCHVDSDCMFVEPVTPDDYFRDGKPILVHASYHWLINYQQANLIMWQDASEVALGWRPSEETMRLHPAVHYRKTYEKTRECIDAHTKRDLVDFMQSGRDEFPQDRVEFPVLGAVAWKFFHDDYHWLNQEKGEWPHTKLVQFWGRGPVNEPQAPVFRDKPFNCTPESLFNIL